MVMLIIKIYLICIVLSMINILLVCRFVSQAGSLAEEIVSQVQEQVDLSKEEMQNDILQDMYKAFIPIAHVSIAFTLPLTIMIIILNATKK